MPSSSTLFACARSSRLSPSAASTGTRSPSGVTNRTAILHSLNAGLMVRDAGGSRCTVASTRSEVPLAGRWRDAVLGRHYGERASAGRVRGRRQRSAESAAGRARSRRSPVENARGEQRLPPARRVPGGLVVSVRRHALPSALPRERVRSHVSQGRREWGGPGARVGWGGQRRAFERGSRRSRSSVAPRRRRRDPHGAERERHRRRLDSSPYEVALPQWVPRGQSRWLGCGWWLGVRPLAMDNSPCMAARPDT